MIYKGYLPTGETQWSRWAVGEYPRIVNADPEYFANLLLNNPRLVACVDDKCFDFLMEKFEQEIRTGIANNWKFIFSLSKEKLIKHYMTFENELKPHFVKRPGLWFYMFRHDSKRKCKVKPNSAKCTVDRNCTCDINLKWVTRIMSDWQLLIEDE